MRPLFILAVVIHACPRRSQKHTRAIHNDPHFRLRPFLDRLFEQEKALAGINKWCAEFSREQPFYFRHWEHRM